VIQRACWHIRQSAFIDLKCSLELSELIIQGLSDNVSIFKNIELLNLNIVSASLMHI